MWNKSSSFRSSRAFTEKYAHGAPDTNASPDLLCLSYTHDDDYEKYKPSPPGKRPNREAGG